jgi:lipid A ethanolaminephosphotransferase
MVVWLSDGYRRSAGVDLDCLRAKAGAGYSHDNLFHSVLGMLGIDTDAYAPDLDIFSSCRRPEPQATRLTGPSPEDPVGSPSG